MPISHDDVGDLRRISISGRLDVDGPDSAAEQLVALAKAAKKAVVVDLTSLKFLASIGIRALITSAKAVQARGGKMALVVDRGSTVMMSIKATGIDQFLPVFDDVAQAEKAAAA
jgi:anti-sigma B factor antagonist